jgi:hypothetical protein
MCRHDRPALLPTLAVAAATAGGVLLLPSLGGAARAGQARGTLEVGVRVVSPCQAAADRATVRQSCSGEDSPAAVLVEGAAAEPAADPRAADLLPLPVLSGDAAGGPAYLTLIY